MNDFLNNFLDQFQRNVIKGSQHYISYYERLQDQAKVRLSAAQSEYKKSAKTWRRVHRVLGLATVSSSIFSAIFTLSTNQWITVIFSLLSALLAGFMTFLNPSSQEKKFRDFISDCFNFHGEVSFASIVIYNKATSDAEKYKKLEELSKSLRSLDQKLSEII